MFGSELDQLDVQAGAGEKVCAGVDTAAGGFEIEDGAGTDHHFRMVANQMSDQFQAAFHRHSDFNDRDTAAGHPFCRKMRIF